MITEAIAYMEEVKQGSSKALARVISFIENDSGDYVMLLKSLQAKPVPVIGITGPPGAGKSTITDALIGELRKNAKRVAVLCVDPSSPFSKGALLGDRIRMNNWYNDPGVFIRSFASHGSLGGLHPKMIEITELLKSSLFDYILVETVGVGQSEIEIASLADITIVVLVPEAGDDIQAMKAGLMEIADVFVVNKCDRPGAEQFIANLEQMRKHSKEHKEIPVIKTIAIQKKGTGELAAILANNPAVTYKRKLKILTEKVYQLIVQEKIKHINKSELENDIKKALDQETFNMYQFAESYYTK